MLETSAVVPTPAKAREGPKPKLITPANTVANKNLSKFTRARIDVPFHGHLGPSHFKSPIYLDAGLPEKAASGHKARQTVPVAGVRSGRMAKAVGQFASLKR